MGDLILIADLDGTFGPKTPTYPDISRSNAEFFRQFSRRYPIIAATGRPRTQARLGFVRGGIKQDELGHILLGGAYEDGLYVESGGRLMFNALETGDGRYRQLRAALFSHLGRMYFAEHSVALIPGVVLKQITPSRYACLDYMEEPLGRVIDASDFKGATHFAYEQGNDVRGTIKAPIGFMENICDLQAPFFKLLEPIADSFLGGLDPDYKDYTYLVRLEDALEIYPRIGESAFRKEQGVEMILAGLDPKREGLALLAIDGKNDIGMAGYVGEAYGRNHLLVTPNRIQPELETYLEGHIARYPGSVHRLKADCRLMGEGIAGLLRQRGLW